MSDKIETGVGQISILLADDSEASCDRIKTFLEEENYKVVNAKNGYEAVKLGEVFLPDLIILDDIMPDLNGYRACVKIKENHRTRLIPVLMITSLREQDDRMKVMDSGADDYLTRPVDKRELVFRVRHLLEIKRRRSEVTLLQRLASLGRLAGGVAHEINNPLTGVVTNLGMLQDMKDELSESKIMEICKKNNIRGRALKEIKDYFKILREREDKRKRMIGLAIKGGRRCSRIVGELLSYSSAQRKWEPAKVRVKEVIQRALSLVKGQFEELGVKINFESAQKPVEVMGNKWELQQVFMSLLTNAFMAIEDSQEKQLAISFSRDRNSAVIRIKDSGCGIHKENLESIFDYFYTTRDEGKGYGLGLSTVYGIILKHNGTVDVKSELGKGTEFIVKIPLA